MVKKNAILVEIGKSKKEKTKKKKTLDTFPIKSSAKFDTNAIKMMS